MRKSYLWPSLSVMAAAWVQAAPLNFELSFKDSFDAGSSSDLNTDTALRQTGRLAPLNYATTANPPQIGDPGFPGGVLLTSNSYLSPVHNFTEGRRFTLEFDVNPGIDDDPGDGLSADWCAVVFGATAQNIFVNASDGVGILFRNNGDIQTFDGGAAQYGGPGITGGCPRDKAFHVRIEVSAGNFTGAPVTVQMYVDDKLAQIGAGNATTLTKAAGFKNNFVTLMGYGSPTPWLHGFDNLTVSAVPDIQVAPQSRTIDKLVSPTSDPITVTIPAQLIANGAAQIKVTSSAPSVARPTGGSAGGVLTLDFAKGGPTSKTFTIAGVAAGVATFTVEGPADVNVAGGVTVFVTDGLAYDEVLLTDSFNLAGGSLDVNAGVDTRQGGVLKPLTYTEGAASAAGGDADDTTQVGPTEYPNKLVIVNQGGGVSPAHNFREGPEFAVEVELTPGANAPDRSSNDWAAIVVGNSTPNSFVINQDGMGVLFRINGAIEVWDGGTKVFSSAVGILPEPPFKVKLSAKAANFAGAPATLSLTVNGAAVALTDSGNEYVKASGFRNNYITLEGVGANWQHVFEDLKISAKACVDFTERGIESAVGRSETATVWVPSGLVANGPAVVKVVSSDPSVAKLTGAGANGELTLTFAKGGPYTLPVPMEIKGTGSARISIVSAAGACIGDPFAVRVRSGLVKNPSFEENYNPAFPGYSDVAQWEKTGGGGVNQSNGPFHDNSTIPDQARVAFLQGSGSLSQNLTGLVAGKTYWVQFRYNVRGCCGGTMDLATKIDDVEVDRIANIRTAAPNPYYTRNVPFKAAADTARLSLASTATGDATVLIDGVTIVQRDDGNVVIANPSFEASGDVASDGIIGPRLLSGWTGTGTYGVNFAGAGPFADNGHAPDQDHVAFLQGASSLGQTIPRLTAASSYRLQWNYNARSGNTPRLRVKVGTTVVWENDVAPVGAGQAYRSAFVDFVSSGVSVDLLFEQVAAGDQTVLLDDIRLLGQSVTLPCLGVSPGQLELSANQTASVAIAVPAQLIAAGPATIKLRSSNPAVLRLEGAAADGVLSVTFAAGGETLQEIALHTLAVGRANVEVVSAAGLCVDNGVSVVVSGSFVRNPSFEANPAGGFPGYGSILAWTGGSGLNNNTGPFHDNGVVPDRRQIAFLQGSSVLSQALANLVPGKAYWLQFRYNTRNCCGGSMGFTVRFNDTDLLTVETVTPVGGTADYYAAQAEFVPTADSGLLSFNATASGDATLLLDAVTVVQRDAGQVVLSNPSFEAEGIVAFPGYLQPDALTGWIGTGNYGVNAYAVGPFADNGVGPDQDSVAFLQGQGSSLSQNVSGLTSGQNYTLSFAVNARGGNTPQLRVSFNGTTLLEEAITPVGGPNPYATRSIVFAAPATEGALKFEQIAAGDNTLVFDNVQLVKGGTVTQPAPTLSATRTPEGNLRLAWPASFTGWRLFGAGVVSGAYTAIPSPVVVDGAQQYIVVPGNLPQQFFRLQR